ncbi:MAG: alpha/beta hydrolase [Leptospirales bacterium]|nr:alpha/beta hydrolase [Leptospirales bacterium]
MRKFKVVLVSALMLLATATGIFLLVAGHAKRKLRITNPAPGRMVDVGGYRLHIYCVGHGTPTVLFEAGMNDFSLHWSSVQTLVAQKLRACVYDRAGFGWSETGHSATLENRIADLEQLIERTEIAKNGLILVGHSYGGLMVRGFASRHPEQITGLVLVDSAHEDQFRRLPFMTALAHNTADSFRSLRWLVDSGIMALSLEQIPDRGLPVDLAIQYRALLASTASLQTAADETDAAPLSFDWARGKNMALPRTIRLTVISRGRPDQMPGLSDSDNLLLEDEWNKLQASLTSLVPNARSIMATKSRHYIQLDEPALVYSAILEISAK